MQILMRTAAVAVATLIGGAAAHAEGPRSHSHYDMKSAAKKLTREAVITSATVDRTAETITFNGFNFGSRKPYVYAETSLLTVLSATDEEVVVSFPVSAVPDGSYLFTLIRNSVVPSRVAFSVAVTTAAAGDGQTGPMGPQGPAGPQGLQGPQGQQGPAGPAGAAGANGVNGVSGYVRAEGDTGEFPFDPGDVFDVYAACPSGQRVLGGGHELLLDGARLTVLASKPSEASNAWVVQVRNGTSSLLMQTQVKAFALCAAVQ
jgi:hypothetical protein